MATKRKAAKPEPKPLYVTLAPLIQFVIAGVTLMGVGYGFIKGLGLQPVLHNDLKESEVRTGETIVKTIKPIVDKVEVIGKNQQRLSLQALENQLEQIKSQVRQSRNSLNSVITQQTTRKGDTYLATRKTELEEQLHTQEQQRDALEDQLRKARVE